MNIFEGARRIAKLIVALIVVGFGFAIVYDSPSPVSISYLIAGATKPPARVEQCEVGDISQTKEITSKSGAMVNVNLCFKSSLLDESRSRWLITPNSKAKNTHDVTAIFADGTMHIYAGVPGDIIPDVVEAKAEKEFKKKVVHLDGNRGAYAAGSSELARAIPAALGAFQIPKADEGYITRLEWFQRAQSAGLYFLGMFASLAGFWLFVWTVGWIVRGFKGIPQGRDSGG